MSARPLETEAEADSRVLHDTIRRLVWVGAGLVCLRGNGSRQAGKIADDFVEQFDNRFPLGS